MVRLADLEPPMQEALRGLPCEPLAGAPFVAPPALGDCRVAIVSTAGLGLRGERPFHLGATDYRVIPGDVAAGDLVMTHISSNFDRTGFQQDRNVVFPLDRLRELAEEGEIGSVADYHYSFMGATAPDACEGAARSLAKQLLADDVRVVLLVPV